MCLGGILPRLPLNLIISDNARDHHRAPPRNLQLPTTSSHCTPWHASFGRIGILNRTEAMPRTAMQRGGVLEAERQVLALPPRPAIYYHRRAICHGAEPLVHVFRTYRVHGGVLVILTSTAL